MYLFFGTLADYTMNGINNNQQGHQTICNGVWVLIFRTVGGGFDSIRHNNLSKLRCMWIHLLLYYYEAWIETNITIHNSRSLLILEWYWSIIYWQLKGGKYWTKGAIIGDNYIMLSKIMVLFHGIDEEQWLYWAIKLPQTNSLFRMVS